MSKGSSPGTSQYVSIRPSAPSLYTAPLPRAPRVDADEALPDDDPALLDPPASPTATTVTSVVTTGVGGDEEEGGGVAVGDEDAVGLTASTNAPPPGAGRIACTCVCGPSISANARPPSSGTR